LPKRPEADEVLITDRGSIFLDRHVDEHAIAQNPGVIDQHVEITERVHCLVNHVLRPIPIRHIVVVGHGRTSRRGDLVHHLLGWRSVGPGAIGIPAEIVNYDLGAFGGKE
jgi:hypothetical protein